jgi:sugar lactone lactonase YvrE
MRALFALIMVSTVVAELPRHVVTISDLQGPVCVLHDPEQDVYFVSNINGAGTARDNNGYVSRVAPDGTVTVHKFIEGGRSGVMLNAPKGLAILGDELWVADIDSVRAFNRRTGRPVRAIHMPPPGGLFLNEMAAGPDQAIYVTDTRLEFHGDDARHLGPDRVFRIGEDGRATTALEGNLEAPSGIVWDAPHRRFLITALQGPHIFEWRPGRSTASSVWQGVGGYDGIILDGDGWLVSSLKGEGIYAIHDGREERIIDRLITPAAIGFDVNRRHLLVPSFEGNTVQIWNIGAQ